ncbi:MAG: hypothetical protein PWR08_1550 [Thermoanaerobacterium sp.]|nr:hypothetical protein [Thermoanaerobacterium sp.]
MAGRPSTKTNVNDNELVKKNEELEKELEKMKEMLQKLMAEKKVDTKQNSEIKEEEVFPEIPMHKPIKVMSLYTGGLNLKKYEDDKTPFRFNFFGETQPILYGDLVKIISHQRKFFEEGYCVVLDNDVIKVHYLEKFMKKILDKKTIDRLLEYDDEKIKDLYNGTTKQLKQTIVDLIVDKIVKKEYVDRNKVAVISELYGKDLYEIAEHLK